jgi:hypothetical protein
MGSRCDVTGQRMMDASCILQVARRLRHLLVDEHGPDTLPAASAALLAAERIV